MCAKIVIFPEYVPFDFDVHQYYYSTVWLSAMQLEALSLRPKFRLRETRSEQIGYSDIIWKPDQPN